jgi:hypothetical protein
MPSRIYGIFREAILGEKQVTCTYGGHYRELCPHIIGHKDGDEKVLVFQFGGSSSTRLPPRGEWRCLQVARVEDARIRDGEWHTGTLHQVTQKCVEDIDLDINVHVRKRPRLRLVSSRD